MYYSNKSELQLVMDDENTTWPEYPVHLFPAPLLTGVTVTCVLLFVTGILGNVMTMLVVSRFKDMRTTTNLYLSSMALSDLLIFLCMPLDLFRLWQYRPWNFGDLLCKLFQFVSESCTYSTILNITALSVERYLAVCFPLWAKVVVTKGKVKSVILVLWAVSFVSAGPIFVLVGVEHENGTDPLDTNECRTTEYAIQSGLLTVMVWTSSVFFFLPAFCLTVLYSLIVRKLWRRKRKDIGPRTSIRDKYNTQTVKMLGKHILVYSMPCLLTSPDLRCEIKETSSVSWWTNYSWYVNTQDSEQHLNTFARRSILCKRNSWHILTHSWHILVSNEKCALSHFM